MWRGKRGSPVHRSTTIGSASEAESTDLPGGDSAVMPSSVNPTFASTPNTSATSVEELELDVVSYQHRSPSSSSTAHLANNMTMTDVELSSTDGHPIPSGSSRPPLSPSTHHRAEPSLVLFFQVLFPFLIAGLGMVLAGIVLDIVKDWELFKQVPEIFILVPALLGLKGNLEMTLASRLSTQANTGKMDSPGELRRIVTSNLALIQVQATVVTLLATAAAVILGWIPRGQINWGHATLLCASSLTTAALASLILSLIMVAVIVGSKRLRINPDNIATPIAASLGDLTTLAVLACFGTVFLHAHRVESWLNMAVIIAFLASLPLFSSIAGRSESTTRVLRDGWTPIIFSMLISSSGGFVLERAMRKFQQVALFQPVINGVGGNLAAVHASRLSTYFHRASFPGLLPNGWTVARFSNFQRAFFSSDWDARSARVLLFLVVPGHILFNWLIGVLHMGENPPHTATFTALYLLAAFTQVTVLLFVCQWMVALMWQWGVDPDNAAIPYLTALGDLLGTTLLFLCFSLLAHSNEPGIVKNAVGAGIGG